jgi:hypothetical protein
MERAAPLTDRRGRLGSRRSVRSTNGAGVGENAVTTGRNAQTAQRVRAEARYGGCMGNSQWQHYLPKAYLKGFSTASGEVWRYDRVDGALKLLPPPVIGAERDLYSIVNGEEVSQEIERNWFSPLDGRFGPILRKIQEQKVLSTTDLTHLANFVAYLRVRTPEAIRETELTIRQVESQIGVTREKIDYRSGPPDHGSDSYVVKEEQSDTVSRRRGDALARNEVLNVLIKTGLSLAEALIDLTWTVLVASHGRSFIVGDNPFVIVPPRSHRTDIEGVGPLAPGAATFVPLSAELCLRLTNIGNATSRRQIDGASVRAINGCQVLNSERYLFGPSDAGLNSLTARLIVSLGVNLAQVVIREAPSVSDSSRSLLHSFKKSKVLPEWADIVPLD